MISKSVTISALCLVLGATATASHAESAGDYGLDCSWPIHGKKRSPRCESMFPHQMELYEEYLQGCREKWGAKGAARCDSNELDRLEMSWRQPQSMVVSIDFIFWSIVFKMGARLLIEFIHLFFYIFPSYPYKNYTSTGFKKLKAPPKLWNIIKDYWEKNKGTKGSYITQVCHHILETRNFLIEYCFFRLNVRQMTPPLRIGGWGTFIR